MDGSHDGETQALTASQEMAPSPLLQERPEEDLGAVREEGATEPSLTPKGARALAAKTLARRRACRRLDRTVAELVQFLLLKDRKNHMALQPSLSVQHSTLDSFLPPGESFVGLSHLCSEVSFSVRLLTSSMWSSSNTTYYHSLFHFHHHECYL